MVSTAAAAILCGWPALAAAQTKTAEVEAYDEVYVQAFTPMNHPGPFDASGDGYVTVRLALDRQGNVKDAVAVSGPRNLVAAAVENAKQLRIQPRSSRTLVVVYQFTVVDACFGTSYWIEHDLITVTGCRRLYSPE
jgi:hypothetical protein